MGDRSPHALVKVPISTIGQSYASRNYRLAELHEQIEGDVASMVDARPSELMGAAQAGPSPWAHSGGNKVNSLLRAHRSDWEVRGNN